VRQVCLSKSAGEVQRAKHSSICPKRTQGRHAEPWCYIKAENPESIQACSAEAKEGRRKRHVAGRYGKATQVACRQAVVQAGRQVHGGSEVQQRGQEEKCGRQ